MHNSMRSMNHLHLNKQTGLYECVSGFHCLEDGGSTTVTPSNFRSLSNAGNMSSTVNENNSASNYAPGVQSLLRSLPGQSRRAKDGQSSHDNYVSNTNDRHGHNGMNTNGKSPHDCASGYDESNGTGPREESGEPTPYDLTGSTLGIDMLQSLLQSVRELEAQGKK